MMSEPNDDDYFRDVPAPTDDPPPRIMELTAKVNQLHEAGHAVFAWALCGRPTSGLVEQICAPDSGGGHTQFFTCWGSQLSNEEKVAVFLAGAISQSDLDITWSSSAETVERSFSSGSAASIAGDDWNQITTIEQDECKRLILLEKSLGIGVKQCSELTGLITSVATQLCENGGSLSENDFHACVSNSP